MKKDLVCVIFGAIILCFLAFHNKFPLLTIHSGVYIREGFGRSIFHETASLYGLFISHSSWGSSIWIVVFTQALLLAAALFYFFKYTWEFPGRNIAYTGFLLFSAFFLPASYVASTIAPGIFSAISIIGTALLLLAPKLGNGPLYGALACIAVGCCMDQVNVVPVLLTSGGYRVMYAWRSRILNFTFDQVRRMKLLLLTTGVIGLSVAIVCLMKHDMDPQAVLGKFSFPKMAATGQISEVYQPGSLSAIPGLRLMEISRPNTPMVNSESFNAIHTWFNWETRNYFLSRQYQNWLSLDYLNYSQLAISLLLILANILLLVKYPSGSPLILFLFGAITIHIVTSALLRSDAHGAVMQTVWLLLIPVCHFAGKVLSSDSLYHPANK